jgi:hypothetical protein
LLVHEMRPGRHGFAMPCPELLPKDPASLALAAGEVAVLSQVNPDWLCSLRV